MRAILHRTPSGVNSEHRYFLANGAVPEELRTFLTQTFAKWQLPDAFVFLDAIPRAPLANSRKIALREQFANWKWET